MYRLVVLGCVLAMGCASTSPHQAATPLAPTADIDLSVSAGPPEGAHGDCAAIALRIESAQTGSNGEARTWLNAPTRMVEGRRLRALSARAAELGCFPPAS